MNPLKVLIIASIIVIGLSGCMHQDLSFDASGAFETEETIISSEATGVIKQLTIEEGQPLKTGQIIGYIDSIQLHLKKEQIMAEVTALLGGKPDISIQLSALQEQLSNAEKNRNRIANLVEGKAATGKQLDDMNTQVAVLKKQIEALKSSLNISTNGINKNVVPLQLQMAQLNDQINKCKIINPINGTVLVKYAEANEMATIGKPLYKIADLSVIFLRAYITGNQLPQIKLNQKVTVLTDDGKGGYKKTKGIITWINDKAEFTPKTIQTKDERANLVYAIKVKVKNNGTYKIGMYGEIKFDVQ